MEPASINFNSEIIHYKTGGHGSNILFCFHGYGETSESFSFLEDRIKTKFTIFAIDMPFHGDTRWSHNKEFDTDALKVMIQKILDHHGLSNKKFSLMGFSMGGRFALSAIERMSSQIDKVILMAPDGLKVNFWYWFATQTWLGNKVFGFTVDHPAAFLWLLNISNRFKLVNQSIYKFVHHYLDDRNIRKMLFLRWTCFRKIKPDITTIKQKIIIERIPIHILYGKHDRIILPTRGLSFRNGIEDLCTVELVNSGHQILQEKNAYAILKYLPL